MPAFKKIVLVALVSLSKVNAFPTRAGLRDVNIKDTVSRIEDLRERINAKVTESARQPEDELMEIGVSEEFEESNDEGPSEFELEMAELDIVIGEMATMDKKQLKGLKKSLARMSLSEYAKGFTPEEKEMLENKLEEIKAVIEIKEPEDELMEIGVSAEFEESNDEGSSEFELEMAELDIVIGEVPTMDKKQLKGLKKSLARMSLSEYEKGFTSEEKEMLENKLEEIKAVIEIKEPEDELMEIGASEEYKEGTAVTLEIDAVIASVDTMDKEALNRVKNDIEMLDLSDYTMGFTEEEVHMFEDRVDVLDKKLNERIAELDAESIDPPVREGEGLDELDELVLSLKGKLNN